MHQTILTPHVGIADHDDVGDGGLGFVTHVRVFPGLTTEKASHMRVLRKNYSHIGSEPMKTPGNLENWRGGVDLHHHLRGAASPC